MHFGGRTILSGADMLVRNGDRIGLVGPNGAGKSTVFKIIAGIEIPDEGEMISDPGLSIGYFSQDTGEMRGSSVIETVMGGDKVTYDI